MGVSGTAHSPQTEKEQLPLCVDLDGTLVRSDVLLESSIALLRARPIYIFAMMSWLPLGRARFKDLIAQHVELDVSNLPYRKELVAYLTEERAGGRTVVLTTASSEKFATQIADHLGCFDDVMASSASRNLKGRNKAEALVDRFGEGAFTYIGDSIADLPIWKRAGSGIVVGGSRRVTRAAKGLATTVPDFEEPQNRPAALFRALRPQQWLKNLLLFVPVLAAHQVGMPGLIAATAGFVAFCLVASSAYVLNDLLDLVADRSHPVKRRRPFASGELSPVAAFWLLPALIASGALIAAWLPIWFAATLLLYFLLTLSYSLHLKRVVLADVMTLAALYTLRVIAGGAAASVTLSFWLLAFSMFLFFSLALVKRTAEMQLSRQTDHDLSRRGYRVGDETHLETMGIASGYLAVLVIALYINSENVTTLYADPYILWLLCPILLYWISRVWLKTNRGEMPDDPLVFTVKDRVSHLLALATVAILVGAL